MTDNKKEEIQIKDYIAYLRYFNSFYKITALDKGIYHQFLRARKTGKAVKEDFFIPYENFGKVIDGYELFDNFRFKEFGKFKKSLYIMTGFFLVMGVYFLPKVLFYYFLVAAVIYGLYMFYKGNKNYVRVEVFIPQDKEILYIVYQFKTHQEKMNFIKHMKKHNDPFLKAKTEISYVVDRMKKLQKKI